MKLDLVNCKKCGNLFKKKSRNVCERCIQLEKMVINKIVDFVDRCAERSEPFTTLKLISEGTGVEFGEIDEIYKSGQLLTYTTNKIIVSCSICNEEKRGSEMKGYFCEKCYEDVAGKSGLSLNDPEKIKIDLKKFDKDIMHTRKNARSQESRFGLGSKRNK